MDGLGGTYLMLAGVALIIFIAAIWPSRKKDVQ